jgi:hypothetical protein
VACWWTTPFLQRFAIQNHARHLPRPIIFVHLPSCSFSIFGWLKILCWTYFPSNFHHFPPFPPLSATETPGWGDPNGPGLPHWPSWQQPPASLLNISDQPVLAEVPWLGTRQPGILKMDFCIDGWGVKMTNSSG